MNKRDLSLYQLFFAAIYSKNAIPVERRVCFKLEMLKMKTGSLHGVDMSRSDS